MGCDKEFSQADLKAIFTSIVFKGKVGIASKYKPPSDPARAKLAEELNGLRELVANRREDWEKINERRKAVRDAMTTIEENLPSLVDLIDQELALTLTRFITNDSRACALEDKQAFDSLKLAILNLRNRKFLMNELRLGFDVKDWKPLAEILADRFIDALRSTNPGVAIGVSEDGPVSKFAEAVLPKIYGKSPKVGTISAHLKKVRRVKRVIEEK